MNVLFLTMYNFRSINQGGIYEDLMKEFVLQGNNVFVVSPTEKRYQEDTRISEKDENFSLLRVKTGNLQKTNVIEKGLSTLQISSIFKRAINKHFANQKFDLILYSTPPITLVEVIKYLKKRDGATTFLLLKDIFPQNAIDINVLSKSGLKGIIHKYFRKKECELYEISNYIGCMSAANVNYVLANNPELNRDKLLIVPNSIEPKDLSLTSEDRNAMRKKYGIPQDKTVFVYGGNLGKPQDIPFIIECLKTQKENDAAYFLIAGDGTEFDKLQLYIDTEKPQNVKLLKRLPREDFDSMLAACDVGLIFLDHRFTIPNYPSRLLSYMQAGIPVFACTDRNTDIGKDIVDNEFGWWCESNDINGFAECVREICNGYSEGKGKKANEYLHKYFTVLDGYRTIMNTIENS